MVGERGRGEGRWRVVRYASAIGGGTGDRERRRLSRKFGNYRCRVVVVFSFFFFFSSPFFFRRVILIWERQFVFAARVYSATRRGDAAAAAGARCITTQRASRGHTTSPSPAWGTG